MQNKKSSLKIRCTYNEKLEIQRKAERAGMTMSEYVINTALKSRNRIRTPKKDLISAVTMAQVSVNELANAITNEESAELEEACSKVEERLDDLWRIL